LDDQLEKLEMAGHVARMGKKRGYTGFWCGNMRERDHLEDPSLGERITLRLIFTK